jgi:hypothetical protein
MERKITSRIMQKINGGIMKIVLGTIVGLFLIYPSQIKAAVYGEFGTAIAHQIKTIETGAKNIEFGWTDSIYWGRYQVGLGGWEDKSGVPGVEGSLYGQLSFGLEPDLEGAYINYHIGPSFISQTDSMLGSRWQIFQEIGFGVKDYRDIRIGIVIKHWSNGAWWGNGVNSGRNFLNLRVQF